MPHEDIWSSNYSAENKSEQNTSSAGEVRTKRKAFGISGLKTKRNKDNDNLSNMSRVHSKAIAFTGRGGAGVSSTLMNVAYAAAKKGMRAFILDLDTEYRTVNLYFNKFCTLAEESEDVARSLIRTLANPQGYMETAVPVSDNLWVCALGYNFADSQALENFFTEQRIAALVSALKNRFDFVFVDIPLRVLSQLPAVMMHFDTFALCVENNIYSAVSTLRSMITNFKSEDIRYLNLKSKLVVTKFNDESVFDDEILTAERLAALMIDDVCDEFVDDLDVAGEVPYVVDYDRQIENDIPVYETNALLAESFDRILARL